jgi:hypothetical protein
MIACRFAPGADGEALSYYKVFQMQKNIIDRNDRNPLHPVTSFTSSSFIKKPVTTMVTMTSLGSRWF